MVKKIAVLTTALIVAFAPIALSAQEDGSGGASYNKGKEATEPAAPDFSLKDLAGKAYGLRDYSGKTVLLVFTTTWCPYCVKKIPDLKKMYQEYGNKGFEIIAIYIQESNQRVASFARKYDLPYTILLDSDGKVADSYDVAGVPTMVVVNGKGRMVCWDCRKLDSVLKKELGTP